MWLTVWWIADGRRNLERFVEGLQVRPPIQEETMTLVQMLSLHIGELPRIPNIHAYTLIHMHR